MENQELPALTSAQIIREDIHNIAAVKTIALAMTGKLIRTTREGRSGWHSDECSNEILSTLLIESVKKGDPVDIANYAAMLHARGERVLFPESEGLMAIEATPATVPVAPRITPTGIVHQLRTHHAPFDAVAAGVKTCEIRVNDRNFSVGDILELFRSPSEEGTEQLTQIRVISHIQKGYGLRDDAPWVVLSFADLVPQGLPTARISERDEVYGPAFEVSFLDEAVAPTGAKSLYVYAAKS